MSHPSGPGSYGQPGPYQPGPYHPGSYHAVHTQVLAQPYRCSTAHIVIAWVVAVFTLGYMLPWAIAATRHKSNTAVIALINLLLGWSLVGWIVALVMSVTTEPQPVVYVNTAVLPPHQQVQHPPHPYGYPAAQAPIRQQAEPTMIMPPYDPRTGHPPTDYR